MATFSKDALGAVSAGAAVVLVVLWIRYGLRRVFSYPFRGPGLAIQAWGVTVRYVPLSDIDGVEVIPFGALVPFSPSFRWDAFLAWKWCGYSRTVVCIKRRAGWVKCLIVSPEQPDAFAASLVAAVRDPGARDRRAGSSYGEAERGSPRGLGP